MEEFPTSFRSQARAAAWVIRNTPRTLRLTPGQRDRIVREVRAERAERGVQQRPRRRLARSA